MRLLELTISADIPWPDHIVAAADMVKVVDQLAADWCGTLDRMYGIESSRKLMEVSRRGAPAPAPPPAREPTPNAPLPDTRPVAFETLGDPGEIQAPMRRT